MHTALHRPEFICILHLRQDTLHAVPTSAWKIPQMLLLHAHPSYTENVSVVAMMCHTSMVRPLLCHTTHRTNSDRLNEPVSNEPGINPLSWFQNSIQNSQPALIASLTGLICGVESGQLALGFSQQIELPLLCKPGWPYQMWGIAMPRSDAAIFAFSYPLLHPSLYDAAGIWRKSDILLSDLFSSFFQLFFVHDANNRHKHERLHIWIEIFLSLISALIVPTWKRKEGERKG